MFSKEEEKVLKKEFWDNFKSYCKKTKNKRRWLLQNISVPFSQLKFDANRNCAIVGIQIDDKKPEKKYLIFSYWAAYKTILEDFIGEGLTWEKDYLSNDNRYVSMVYFRIDNVDILRHDDNKKIYDFFISKMSLLEDAVIEIQDSITEGIKNNN